MNPIPLRNDIFIKHHADIMAKSIIDETPLLLAVVNMHEEATKELIAAGADVTFRDASGRSIIDYVTTSSPLSAILEVNSSNSHRVNAGVIPNDSLARFVRSVVRNIDSKPRLSRWNFWQDYTELACLFLTMGREWDSDTRVCLERLTAMHGGRMRYAASCEGCTRDYVESGSAFHICRTCYMQIICHDCYKKRIDEKTDAPPKGCLPEHDYLEFGGTEWKALAPRTVNSAGEMITDFLNRIREEFQGPDSEHESSAHVPQPAPPSETAAEAIERADMSELPNGGIEN
jgi:hypothetical protein